MITKLKAVDRVRNLRRVSQRVAVRVAEGTLGQDEVDLVSFLFGGVADQKLAASGLLSDGGILDEAVASYAEGMLERYEMHARVDEVEAEIAKRVERFKRDRGPLFDDEPGTAESKRKAKVAEASNIRLLAVHLNQRALVVALSRVLVQLSRDQIELQYVKGHERADFLHGPIRTNVAKTGAADGMIEAMRAEGALRTPKAVTKMMRPRKAAADAAPSEPEA